MALPAPLGATSGKDRASPGILRAPRTAWAGPGGAAAKHGCRCPRTTPCSLTWAPAQAPALDLLADEAAEQAGQRAEAREVLHAVDGDVQRRGRQQPQLSVIGVLHACRGVGVSCPSCSQDRWAPARHPAGRGSFPSHRPTTPQAPERGHPAGPPRETGWCEGAARHPKVPLRLCHACLGLCGVWGQEGGQCAFLGILHTPGLGSGTEDGLCFPESLPPSLEFPSQGTELMTGQLREQSKEIGRASCRERVSSPV